MYPKKRLGPMKETRRSSCSSYQWDKEPIKIDAANDIYSVTFLTDGMHLVGGGEEGKLRRWQVKDGKEAVGRSMNAGSTIFNIAVSQDGQWIVTGTKSGKVLVWDAARQEKAMEIQAHTGWVYAVDISSEGTRVASGSDDKTLRVWSILTGERLVDPLGHDDWVVATKFSPNGQLIATATWGSRESVRIYNSQDGCLLVDFPIRVYSLFNQTLAWASDSERLFALSRNGEIHRLNMSNRTTVSKWPIRCKDPRLISLSNNDMIIAVSDDTQFSFWDAMSQQQIGTVIRHSSRIRSMAISPNYDFVTGGEKTIALSDLCDILPSPYRDVVSVPPSRRNRANYNLPFYMHQMLCEREIRRLKLEQSDLEDNIQSLRIKDTLSGDKITILEKSNQGLSKELASSREGNLNLQQTVRVEAENSNLRIEQLERAVRELRYQLSTSLHTATQNEDGLNEKIADLNATVHELRIQLAGALHNAEQQIDNLNEVIESLKTNSANREIEHRDQLITAKQGASEDRYTLIQLIQCESLYARGHIYDAVNSFLKITDTISKDLRGDESITPLLTEFVDRCTSKLQIMGDKALSVENHNEAVAAYSAALSLSPLAPNTVLMKWTILTLHCRSPDEALGATTKFKIPRFCIYRAICNVLENDNRIAEAIKYFRQISSDSSHPVEGVNAHKERAQWEYDFRQRCSQKLCRLGDSATQFKNFDDALGHYVNALSLNPANVSSIIVKCCETRVGLLEDELGEATKEIELNPASYKGYERKYSALCRTGRYGEAFVAFEIMLSKLESSPDPQIRELRGRYINLTPLIRKVVSRTVNEIPRVLINVDIGRLYDRTLLEAAFEEFPIFEELRSTMTTSDRLDLARIEKEVETFYEYVMFSHKWQPPHEPTFQMLEDRSIDQLPESPGNKKLRGFRNIVRSRHKFRWCWSDTCCVNQANKSVQQESVIAMFRWYRRSALTVIHLNDVLSDTQEVGCLRRSIWNTRGWTYQEYVASPVVQFYTNDWKPYLGLDMWNHKESPVVRSEMEWAMKGVAQELAMLQPGLHRVREKLYLASRRETTQEEDIAYCLFGIFGVSISVIYGEGKEAAVSRLLLHILTHSDNVSVLSWTGNSASNNSYLPSDLTVYDQIVPQHIPQPVQANNMVRMVTALRSPPANVALAVELYERLSNLSTLTFTAGRLKLPGLVFPLSDPVPLVEPNSHLAIPIYHTSTPILGDVRIKTKYDFSGMNSLLLVHPWMSLLLDEDFSDHIPLFDLDTRALRLVVRLMQPFGALLLAPSGRVQYRRVATDSFIKVQIRVETTLKELLDSVRIVDVQ